MVLAVPQFRRNHSHQWFSNTGTTGSRRFRHFPRECSWWRVYPVKLGSRRSLALHGRTSVLLSRRQDNQSTSQGPFVFRPIYRVPVWWWELEGCIPSNRAGDPPAVTTIVFGALRRVTLQVRLEDTNRGSDPGVVSFGWTRDDLTDFQCLRFSEEGTRLYWCSMFLRIYEVFHPSRVEIVVRTQV